MSRSNAVASSSRRRLPSPPETPPGTQPQRRGDRERKPAINGDVKPRVEEDDDEESRDDDDPALQWTIDNFVDVPVGAEGVKNVSGVSALDHR